MSSIKPIKIDSAKYEHFSPEDESIGYLNEYENAELRAQIAEQKAEGYYLIAEGNIIGIDSKGQMDWNKIPNSTVELGSWKTLSILFIRLFKARKAQE